VKTQPLDEKHKENQSRFQFILSCHPHILSANLTSRDKLALTADIKKEENHWARALTRLG
jgi:hypothetical protein